MTLIRSSAPPEKLLKKSSTPPRVVLYSVASARGSTPGSGTWLRNRNTTSVRIVNHNRLRSSVACANFDMAVLEERRLAAVAIGRFVPWEVSASYRAAGSDV